MPKQTRKKLAGICNPNQIDQIVKIVGLTGGIGSGKTTVANFFSTLEIPVYIADVEAKNLMSSNCELQQKLIDLFGNETFANGELNRNFLAGIVFNDPKKLAILNHLVHPFVASDFKKWVSKQKAPYVVKESALLFETGDYKNCDVIILVKAPLEERIKRVMQRDLSSRESVLKRISHQWSDEKKQLLADYTIENTDISLTKNIVLNINANLLNIK